jgi:hypothetical protein
LADNPDQMAVMAKRCRRMATLTPDDQMRDNLISLAQEYDRRERDAHH